MNMLLLMLVAFCVSYALGVLGVVLEIKRRDKNND